MRETRSMWSVDRSKELARELVLGMGSRWSHLVSVGHKAERLAESSDLVSDDLVSAAWLHDIGYAPPLADSRMHAIDGARALQRLAAPIAVVGLVAHHTGAGIEAEERGLLDEWRELPTPDPHDLDILNLIDLSTSPTGQEVRDVDRIAEILGRYEEGHPVHRAVTRSQHELLASSARAKRVLGLPDNWPLVAGKGMADAQPHRGVEL